MHSRVKGQIKVLSHNMQPQLEMCTKQHGGRLYNLLETAAFSVPANKREMGKKLLMCMIRAATTNISVISRSADYLHNKYIPHLG